VVDYEGGRVVIPNYTAATVLDKEGKEIKSFKGTTSHYKNFIEAVHSRKHEDLHADILEGHISSALCHTGNISYRLGKTESPEEIHDAIKNNQDLSESFHRMQEHMAANQVDFKLTPLKLGVPLEMDAKAERFTSSREANQMLTRDYRKPFVVPESV
jgi:hypothetical protein